MSAETAERPTRRGCSNTNVRGNTKTRRRRREWVITTYRANVDILELTEPLTGDTFYLRRPAEPDTPFDGDGWRQAARCYACGDLLTVDTVTCDRILPGAEGGTYGTPLRDTRDRRTNVRPACLDCQSITGGHLGAARANAKRETSS